MRSKFLLAIVFLMLTVHQLHAAGPTITSFSPASGPVGTLVTITGTNMGTPTAFTIGGKAAIVVSNTGTQLVGLVMPGAVTGAVSVTTAGGTGSGPGSFTVAARPNVNMIQSGNVLEGSQLSSSQGYSVAISADGKTAVIGGVSGNNGGHYNAEIAYVFTYSADAWVLQAGLQGAGSNPDQASSSAVAISADGNTILLGAEYDGGGIGLIGATYVFTRTGATWAQQGGPLTGAGATANGAHQGSSVALSADGNTAAIGGFSDNNLVGATWVFTRSGGVWTQQGNKLVGTGYVGQSAQGFSVALSADGNTLITGGLDDNSYVGAAWIFSRSGGVWTQQGNKLSGSDVVTGGLVEQGHGVAISADGNTAMVGGPGDANVGAAWVYTRTGSAWTQQGSKLVGSGSGFKYAGEGTSVALSADGNLALIGGDEDATTINSQLILGSTWEFSRSGITWTQLGNKLTAKGGGNGLDQQGFSVAMSADGVTALVGADEYLSDQGAAYVFTTIAPSAATLPATAVTATGATLNGTVDEDIVPTNTPLANYNLAATTVNMVYSTSPTLATKTTATLTTGTSPMQGGAAKTTFASALTGLTPSTTYYYMITGTNSFGTANGGILSFKTGVGVTAPTATTLAATGITFSGATLNGTVNDNGASTTVQFEYGTAADLSGGTTIPVTTGTSPIAAGKGTTSFTGVLTGLNPSTTYYFRIDGASANGTTKGNILSFITPAKPVITFPSPEYLTYGSITVPAVTSTDPTSPIMYRFVTTGIVQATNDGKFQAIGAGTTSVVAYQYTPGTTNIEAVADGTITVTPAPLTITADSKTITWGQPTPALTATYTGFVNGDTQANLPTTALPTFTTPYAQGASAGNYYIFNGPTGTGTGGNYNITYVNGTITVTQLYPRPAATTVAATNITATGATINGIVSTNQGPNTNVTLQYTDNDDDGLEYLITAVLTTGPNPLPAGSGNTNYAAILTGLKPSTKYYFIINGINPEFTATGDIFTFTTPAAATPTITLQPFSTEVYGSADVKPVASSTNTAIPITFTSSNTAVATITQTGAIHITGVGTSTVTASQTGSGITPATQTFTVTPAMLTITAVSQSKVYGSANSGLPVNYSGFVNGDDTTKLTKKPTVSTAATKASGVGSYPITASGATDPNYLITYTPGTLTVTPAPLLITADNKTAVIGQANVPLTVSYAGFVNSDNPQSLTTPPTAIADLGDEPKVGTYPITVSGAADPNYTITYKSGTYTVTPALTFNPIPAKTYGDPDFDPGATGTNVTYSTGNDGIATIAAGKIHIVNAGTVTITATGSGTSAQQTLTINPAQLTITANNQTKVYGTANPALTLTYNKFVNGDDATKLTTQATVSTTATDTSSVSTYPITVSSAASNNYTITYVSGTLTITQATQSIVFATIPDQQTGSTYDLGGVTASSGLPVTLTLSEQTLASISGTTLTNIQPGSETVTAEQPGNKNYKAATSVSQTYNIISPDVQVAFVVSPNGDGINDVLIVKGIEQYPDNTMVLINRNGVKVYEASGYNNTTVVFDGHSSETHKFQQAGTLLYLLKYRENGVLKTRKGFTELRY